MDQTNGNRFENFRARLAKIVEVGASDDFVSRAYDFWITFIILLNLTVVILSTFSNVYSRNRALLDTIENISAAFFAVDYVLRLIAAKYIYRRGTELRSIVSYVTSFTGIIDLLSFLPCYLPIFFPEGAVAFRVFRIVRIFRLFRINAYYDDLNAIAEVLAKKKQQLISSVFIILVLILASSLCMYSVENAAQPEAFSNAFSGIWWSVSTLLTVGYGDIYPITTLGKILGIIITFLGVGMVAIPTGIISAGFVEQYTKIQKSSHMAKEDDLRFIKISLSGRDQWIGKKISELQIPSGMIIAAIQRSGEFLIPSGDTVLESSDTLVIAAEPVGGDTPIELKEITLLKHHPCNDQHIRDLDISRQTLIVMIKRDGRIIIPNGDTTLRMGDVVLLHSKIPVLRGDPTDFDI